MKSNSSILAQKNLLESEWLSEWSSNPRVSAVKFFLTQRNLLSRPFRRINGEFKLYESLIQTNTEDFSGANIHLIIEANSIHTGNERRDKHLLSADFFNVEQFPFIRFHSTSFEKARDNNYILEGVLRICGVNKKMVLDVIYKGKLENELGDVQMSFQSLFHIKRHDFGFKFNMFFEAFIENEICIQLDLQFVQIPEKIY